MTSCERDARPVTVALLVFGTLAGLPSGLTTWSDRIKTQVRTSVCKQIEYIRQVRKAAEEVSSGMVQTVHQCLCEAGDRGVNAGVDASSQHSCAALRNMFKHHTHCQDAAGGG